ncbi:MAG TPA: sterol desaturase family protein [Methylophilaceae bacterium]|jgi:sterol desaturase/sphingolipid hydroxylase (fatty acid hydroxylase superfamily)
MNTALSLGSVTLPTLLTIVSTIVFLILERRFPGRELPHSKGWYTRAILVNLGQLIITLAMVRTWIKIFGDVSLFKLASWDMPVLEGFMAWFIGTFFFYWWHRIRHAKGWWLLFHQIHHSPSRIELVTSFYKHPIEILSDAILSAVVLYPFLGSSLMGAFWYNFFAGTGEYFYHANVHTPNWLRFFIQTPELHSVHHQFDVHKYNFGDIPIWDRIFGTYKDTTEFAERCGFPKGGEEKLLHMLAFKDVYFEEVTE